MHHLICAAFVVLPPSLLAQEPAQQAYAKALDLGIDDRFGWDVALDGDTMVIGAPLEDSNSGGVDGDSSDDSERNSGAAYVLVRSGSTWIHQAYLKAPNPTQDALFGYSVDISGNTIVIGTYRNGAITAIGEAHVFVRNGATWTHQAELAPATGQAHRFFGWDVAIDGDTIVVTSPIEGHAVAQAGAAYVFQRNGSTWSEQAYLTASYPDPGDHFGTSTAIDGDTVVIGAYGEDSGATGVDGDASNDGVSEAGAAYVFRRTGVAWTLQAYLKASNTSTEYRFGRSVALCSDTIVVGSHDEDSYSAGVDGDQYNTFGRQRYGAAYVFERDEISWSQVAYLKSANPGRFDQFGLSVAIDGDTIVIGAANEDSDADGIDGDPIVHEFDNVARDSGAAYLFTRSGSTWNFPRYVKAAHSDEADQFGNSVAISGGFFAVGAPGESSNATGVNGNQTNDGHALSGAAYVFEVDAGGCFRNRVPRLIGDASSSTGFDLRCRDEEPACSTPPMTLFGACSTAAVPLGMFGCSPSCQLLVAPAYGVVADPMAVGPGLPVGFSFCVQCACLTPTCVVLSPRIEVVVVP